MEKLNTDCPVKALTVILSDWRRISWLLITTWDKVPVAGKGVRLSAIDEVQAFAGVWVIEVNKYSGPTSMHLDLIDLAYFEYKFSPARPSGPTLV